MLQLHDHVITSQRQTGRTLTKLKEVAHREMSPPATKERKSTQATAKEEKAPFAFLQVTHDIQLHPI
jgi:hypothetical protein